MVIQKQCPQSACFRCLPSSCLKLEQSWRTLGAHPIEPLPFGWVVHSRNYLLLPPLLFHTTQTNQGWTHFRNDKEGIFDTLCPRRQITVPVRIGSVCSFVWVFAWTGLVLLDGPNLYAFRFSEPRFRRFRARFQSAWSRVCRTTRNPKPGEKPAPERPWTRLHTRSRLPGGHRLKLALDWSKPTATATVPRHSVRP